MFQVVGTRGYPLHPVLQHASAFHLKAAYALGSFPRIAAEYTKSGWPTGTANRLSLALPMKLQTNGCAHEAS
jgi:hypothetical protein